MLTSGMTLEPNPITFEVALQIYEVKRKDINYHNDVETDTKQLSVMEADVNRSFVFNYLTIPPTKKKLLQSILYSILTTIPVSYTQGMHEIASIFIYYYFNKELDCEEHYVSSLSDKESVEKNKKTKEVEDLLQNGSEEGDDENLDKATTDEMSSTSKKIHEIEIPHEIENQARITITNVLLDKCVKFSENNFSLYHEYIKVFNKMMEKKGQKINEEDLPRFMGSIFTWFTRSCGSYDDMLKLVGWILSTPLDFPFIILAKYYTPQKFDPVIKPLDDGTYSELLKIQKEFSETKIKMEKECKINLSGCTRYALFIGAGVALAIAIGYGLSNRKKE